MRKMRAMKKMRKMRKMMIRVWTMSLLACLALLTVAEAKDSEAWREALERRSVVLVTEAVDVGGIMVGGRGKIVWTWLDRSLLKLLAKDHGVSDAVSNALSTYYAERTKLKNPIEGRDVILISYKAFKRWDFEIGEITVGGYRLKEDDIVTAPFYRVLGEMSPDEEAYLHVTVPSLPSKGAVVFSYGEESTVWEKTIK
jgi:hypothetical protein